MIRKAGLLGLVFAAGMLSAFAQPAQAPVVVQSPDVHADGRDTYLNEVGRPWATHHDGTVAGPQVSTQPGPEGASDLGQVNCSYFADIPLGTTSTSRVASIRSG